jgi:hypothetical protein
MKKHLILATTGLAWTVVVATVALAGDIPDGQIILHDYGTTNAQPIPEAPGTVGPYGKGDLFITDVPVTKGTTLLNINPYQRTLASWRDPLTLPHSRASCVKWASGSWPWGGGWKTCIGWKTQLQWLENTATLRVEVDLPNVTVDQVRQATNDCLAIGTTASLVAAIYTGGLEAAAAFSTALYGCLTARFSGAVIKVSTPITSHWGDWT